jgi:hypothetical protein
MFVAEEEEESTFVRPGHGSNIPLWTICIGNFFRLVSHASADQEAHSANRLWSGSVPFLTRGRARTRRRRHIEIYKHVHALFAQDQIRFDPSDFDGLEHLHILTDPSRRPLQQDDAMSKTMLQKTLLKWWYFLPKETSYELDIFEIKNGQLIALSSTGMARRNMWWCPWLSKQGYVQVMKAICTVLLPDHDDADLQKSALNDWALDADLVIHCPEPAPVQATGVSPAPTRPLQPPSCHNIVMATVSSSDGAEAFQQVMSQRRFFQCLLEVARVWCVTHSFTEMVQFLDVLLQASFPDGYVLSSKAAADGVFDLVCSLEDRPLTDRQTHSTSNAGPRYPTPSKTSEVSAKNPVVKTRSEILEAEREKKEASSLNRLLVQGKASSSRPASATVSRRPRSASFAHFAQRVALKMHLLQTQDEQSASILAKTSRPATAHATGKKTKNQPLQRPCVPAIPSSVDTASSAAPTDLEAVVAGRLAEREGAHSPTDMNSAEVRRQQLVEDLCRIREATFDDAGNVVFPGGHYLPQRAMEAPSLDVDSRTHGASREARPTSALKRLQSRMPGGPNRFHVGVPVDSATSFKLRDANGKPALVPNSRRLVPQPTASAGSSTPRSHRNHQMASSSPRPCIVAPTHSPVPKAVPGIDLSSIRTVRSILTKYGVTSRSDKKSPSTDMSQLLTISSPARERGSDTDRVRSRR